MGLSCALAALFAPLRVGPDLLGAGAVLQGSAAPPFGQSQRLRAWGCNLYDAILSALAHARIRYLILYALTDTKRQILGRFVSLSS